VEEVRRTGGVPGNRYSFTMMEGKPPKTYDRTTSMQFPLRKLHITKKL
jgi:hypothetical protein